VSVRNGIDGNSMDDFTRRRSRDIPDVELRVEPMEPLFTSDTLSRYLGISDRQIRNLVSDGKLTAIKIGASLRFRPRDVDRFLDRHSLRARR
jgi:excisionase family DNA binding protein